MTDGSSDEHLLSAVEAAALLGVKRETLYAYASRGLVTSHRRVGHRGSWFDPVELDRAARRSRSAGASRLSDMQFQSAITLVEPEGYWYRGRDPGELARERSFEQVATWLWGRDAAADVSWSGDDAAVERARTATVELPSHATVLDRLRVAVPVVGATDALRFDLRADQLVGRCGSTLATLAGACGAPSDASQAGRVWALLSGREPEPHEVRLVEQAMILLADHEVAASTAAVRIAASFRADPYAALGSGLAVLSGTFHGAASVEVHRLLEDALRDGAEAAVGEALRREGRVPGLGQVLYPAGDPRYPVLRNLIAEARPDSAAVGIADAVAAIARDRGFPPPNVDFGLAVLTSELGLGVRAGETIFAFGRMAGWLAHAIEEYSERTDLRLRANYVGPRP